MDISEVSWVRRLIKVIPLLHEHAAQKTYRYRYRVLC
jgi:hypothetical protein